MLRWCGRRRRGERGSSLLGVMGTMTILSLFLFVTLSQAVRSVRSARGDQDVQAAIAAAQAGVEDYLGRLNASPDYYLNDNTDLTNSALTTLAGAAGVVVPGASSGATFTYQVLDTPANITATGVIHLKVTGISRASNGHPAQTKSMVATLTADTSGKYAYLSDIEAMDPGVYNPANANCKKYWYAGRNGTAGCQEVPWLAGETVTGPLHSNDTLYLTGAATFGNATTETSSTTTPLWRGVSPTGNNPVFAAARVMPADLSYPMNQAATATDGCTYYGNTKITLGATTMSVHSPATTSAPSRCLDVANRANAQTKNIPSVIYIASTANACSAGNVGFPAANEYVDAAATTDDTTDYDCHNGTAYVSGTGVNHGVTIAAEKDVVVTGNLTQASLSGSSLVGLAAGNYVWIYHPIKATQTGSHCVAWFLFVCTQTVADYSYSNLLGTPVTSIQASLMAVTHSVRTQNYDVGAYLGTVTITGSVSQKYSGPFGVAATNGYKRNIVWDSRLAMAQPPYMQEPGSHQWVLSQMSAS